MIDKIFHVADVHIRNFYRHKEYEAVFNKLYKYIRENKTDNSVIYLAGDIVHSKIDISPELVSQTSKFLKNCADICPTILITGNHDVNLSNDTRMDALTPIVEMLNHKNLHYWKDNGVYELNGVHFSVFSVYNGPDTWVKVNEFEGNYKVALHHGAVHSASTDMDYEIENDAVKTSIFNGFDLVLLGDIHKRQFLNKENTIAYAGSLIQQNHGELLDHGIMVWDVKTKKCEIVDIPNDIAYATIDVEDGKITNDPSYLKKFPKKLRLRLRHKNTNNSRVYDIITQLKNRFKLSELNVINLNESYYKDTGGFKLGNVQDVEYQNELIQEFILSLEDSTLYDVDYIRHQNRLFNTELINSGNKLTTLRNLIWKPIYFEFSNMFSYGEGNKVDFTKFNGIEGLFAPNASGKSVFLDALMFCIFDKCSRTYRSTDILNNRKKQFHCKLIFELNNKKYEIERIGKLNKRTEKVKVNVTFKQITESGEINLTDKDRDSTNKVIRSLLGTYDDFLLTTISTQNDNKNFILRSQRERKDLLNSFLDITIFESLYNIVSDNIKEVKNELYLIENNLNDLNYNGLKANLDRLTQEKTHYKNSIRILKEEIKVFTNNLNELKSKRIDIGEFIDIDKVNSEIKNIIEQLNKHTKSVNSYNSKKQQAETLLKEKQELLIKRFSESYENVIKKHREILVGAKESLSELKEESNKINTEIALHTNKIELASNTKYDPDCKFCMENPLIIESLESKKELPKLNESLDEIVQAILSTEYSINLTQSRLKEYESIMIDIKDIKQEIDLIETEILKSSNAIEILNINKNHNIEKSEKYKKQKEDQKHNELINSKIKKVESEINKKSTELKSVEFRYIQNNEKIKSVNNSLEKYNELKEKYDTKVYEFTNKKGYLSALSKYGVPYQLIKKVIPIVQEDTNRILQSIVDFQIEMECDEKNINCYIKYPNKNQWPVELGSGMEKFILATVMRVALVNISSLPRANFLAIDEGFGVLDSEHLSSIKLLFDFLKSEFNYIICITHLDSMKDLADNLIEISKNENGFSKINV